MPKVLIVEDDPSMAVALQDGFGFENYAVSVANDGLEALKLAEEIKPDLIVLDIMLPHLNGLEVCRKLRQKDILVPIIFLSARGQEIDKVLGLKLGADDYITKPFSFMELLARAEAVLRRSTETIPPPTQYRFGDIRVELAKHRVWRGDTPMELSAREYKLLAYFIAHRGEIVDRDTLLDAVWEHDHPPLTRTVDMHVAKLRKKLEPHPTEPRYFITVHRFGYKFVGSDDDAHP